MTSRPLADAAAIATWLSRSPGYVRGLARAGLITPVTVETPLRGRPRALFDLDQVAHLADRMPSIIGPHLTRH